MQKRGKNAKDSIVSEMTDLIIRHLEMIPEQERQTRLAAFEAEINRGGKRGHTLRKASALRRLDPTCRQK